MNRNVLFLFRTRLRVHGISVLGLHIMKSLVSIHWENSEALRLERPQTLFLSSRRVKKYEYVQWTCRTIYV